MTTRFEIPPEWLEEAFSALLVIQTKVLPIVHAAAVVGEIIDPIDAPIIAGLDVGVSKLFELLVSLRDRPVVDVTDETLRTKTIEAWRATFAALPK